MRDEELRAMFRSFAEPVEGGATPPDPARIRARGRRRRRNLVSGTLLAAAALAAVSVGVRAGLSGQSTPSVGQTAPPATQAPPGPASTAAPATTGPPGSTRAPAGGNTTAPTTTLPLGTIGSLEAVQVTGPSSAVVVGKGAILVTRDAGRTWARVWRGDAVLHDVNFSSATTGWALGEKTVLATQDGGQHWRELPEPAQTALRRVHFVSRGEGWGIAGGDGGQAGEGPMPPSGRTRLVHTTDGGRTWSTLAAPAAPQSVCFTSAEDGWMASGTRVWRSTDGGRTWGRSPSFTLPVPAGGPPVRAELQCARPSAAWVNFSGGGAAAGHSPYALYTTRDGGSHWRGVLAEGGTLATKLRLPAGPGSTPGPFSVIDPSRAFVLSPTPAAGSVGGVLAGDRLSAVPAIPDSRLQTPLSVGFASPTRGYVVGRDAAGRAVLLATGDGGRTWTRQLSS
jgi:photosystem II stability/assembly factor-like uncharacterized protein